MKEWHKRRILIILMVALSNLKYWIVINRLKVNHNCKNYKMQDKKVFKINIQILDKRTCQLINGKSYFYKQRERRILIKQTNTVMKLNLKNSRMNILSNQILIRDNKRDWEDHHHLRKKRLIWMISNNLELKKLFNRLQDKEINLYLLNYLINLIRELSNLIHIMNKLK